MQIHLKEADLKQAVEDFIFKMGVTRPVSSIDFTATRGSDGVLTSVELIEDDSILVVTPKPTLASVGDLIAAKVDPQEIPFKAGSKASEAFESEEVDDTASSLFS